MTVAEMIQKLQNMPQDAVLVNDDSEEITSVIQQGDDEVMLSEWGE